ncbi:MAG TPA: glycosyltransferase family 4 protein [Pyrinomonadaceae bacterium]|nr:glycosyltransferase family 4 protein [Acidobacteriota bacterium]HQZ97965.1 glycosyltransferase family 4 protein [Pyrinomonadaceae bacterium]
MHVCHICDSSVQGDYFRNIAAGLTRKGVRVSLVELGPGKPPTWLGEFSGVTYRSLNAAGKKHYPGAVRHLARFLKAEKVDILHTHLFYSGLIGVLTRRLGNRSIVALMRHHTSVVRMLGSRFHVKADKWMAEKADHVLTVSNAAKAYMLDVDGIRRNDIEVVHLGFNFEQLAPSAVDRSRIRAEFGFAEEDIVVGYVANFAHGKGHIQLVEAFEKIAAEIPNARLVFAGRGEIAEVNEAAAKFPAGKIVFAGWQNDIAAFLNAIDIFVQPSLSEAFSQVIMEAMGVGLPVVATNVGGANEVIVSGENGVLIEPNNVSAISNEVIRLSRDPELRRQLGVAARKTVTESFTAERMVERQFELYQKWLA